MPLLPLRRVLVVLLLALVARSAPAQTRDDPRATRVESSLIPIRGDASQPQTILERLKHYKIAGASVAVIDGGKIAWARGYGLADKEENRPVTPETLFQAGSISKPVAAIGTMKLVQEGRLNLEEDVNRKLISWKVPENEFTKEKPVTLQRVLSHTAGLTVHGFPGYAEDKPVPTVPQILQGEKPANTSAVRVTVLPGKMWRYSGGGFTLMQLLVMDVTGKPYADFLRENVLDPAGMKDSTYQQPLPVDRAAAAATGYRMNGAKVVGRYHTYPEQAAAGLWTTPSDLARLAIAFHDAWTGKSEKLLKQETARQMLTKQHVGPCGLGWFLQGKGPTLRFLHNGRNEGFDCLLTYCTATGQGVVVMVNGNSNPNFMREIELVVAKEYGWPK